MFLQITIAREGLRTLITRIWILSWVCSQVILQTSILTGEKKFVCSLCQKAYSQNTSLKNHLRTNWGENPYPCNHCPKFFSSNGDLKKHLRVYSGQKPYHCKQCPKAFSVVSNLQNHLRPILAINNYNLKSGFWGEMKSLERKRKLVVTIRGGRPYSRNRARDIIL